MPHETELKERRHREILTLLRRGRVRDQAQVVALLERRGIEATQSSVSRDFRELGVAKVAGRYVAPPQREGAPQDLEQAAGFLRAVRPAGPHLAVVQCQVGTAQTVALALDRAAWPEVVGTIAGDDTVFVATASPRDQKHFLQRLDALMLETTP
jgi:transcriptional regulator of arginine metabolism